MFFCMLSKVLFYTVLPEKIGVFVIFVLVSLSFREMFKIEKFDSGFSKVTMVWNNIIIGSLISKICTTNFLRLWFSCS